MTTPKEESPGGERKIKFPKRAKLITDGGFSRMIDIDGFHATIHTPLMRKIRFASPEVGDIDLSLSLNIEFRFEKAMKKFAIYRQTGVVSIVK